MMDYELLSFVKRSKRRRQILRELSDPTTPTEIADNLGVSVSHVSRTLGDFEDKDIVECKTPDAKIGRIYVLKEEGREILDALED